jgi:acetyl esterase/lipase
MTRPVHITRDIQYATVDGTVLLLDLYRPADVDADDQAVPVVLYLHGGGWQVGDKSDDAEERLEAMASHGIAVASANYRFASQGIFPAQIHDTKAAVRWLRANASAHGLAAERIGIWGASAGAYLASLVALTPGVEQFEGSVGEHLDQSSTVAVAVHWFGQSDLLANSRRTWLEKKVLNPPFEGPLLGTEDVSAIESIAREASPLSWVNQEAPPFLIAHGDRDRITPATESIALHDALVRAGAQSSMLLLGGAGHEGPEFDSPANIALTAAFLTTHLTSGSSSFEASKEVADLSAGR